MIEAVLRHRDTRLALIAPAQDERLTYAELSQRVEEIAEHLLQAVPGRRLVFLAPGPDPQAVLRAGGPGRPEPVTAVRSTPAAVRT